MIVTPTLICGGSEKFVSMICNHIDTQLFSVCLLVVNNDKPFYLIENPDVEVVDLKKKRVLFSLPFIKSTVKKFEPDIIFSTANHLNLYLAIFRKRFKAEIRFIAREASIVSINIRETIIPALYSWLIKKYYNRFDLVICQSVYMQEDLVSHFYMDEHQTTVIHNAVQEVYVKPAEKNLQPAEKVYKFITVARLNDVKGIERLIRAAGLLSISFKYYIVGEGCKRSELQQLIADLHLQDKVFLTGEKAHPFEGMEDADLFLMGSYYEGFPNVLLEAGARGIPAIAFRVPGGISEIIREGENGLLIEDNDVNAYAAAINTCDFVNFNHDTIMEIIRKRFAVNNMISRFQNTFLKITENK